MSNSNGGNNCSTGAPTNKSVGSNETDAGN